MIMKIGASASLMMHGVVPEVEVTVTAISQGQRDIHILILSPIGSRTLMECNRQSG